MGFDDSDHSQDVEWQDLVYRREGASEVQARVYVPDGGGPFPLLIDLHGGAWRQFDRTRNHAMNLELCAHGIVIASLDFSLMGEAPYPADMADINFGVRWFKANAARFNAAADCVGGFGVSSGGHQILLNAMRPADPRYVGVPLDDLGDVDAALDFVIVANAPLDLPSAARHLTRLGTTGVTAQAMTEYFGGSAGLREASPHRMLMAGAPSRRPPLLLIQGMDDPMAIAEHSVAFAQSWGEEGGYVELILIPGAGHMFLNPGVSAPSDAMRRGQQAIRSFIKRQIRHLDDGQSAESGAPARAIADVPSV